MNSILEYSDFNTPAGFKNVKVFDLSEVPDTIYNVAMELMGSNALDYGLYLYKIGEFTSDAAEDPTSYDQGEVDIHTDFDQSLIAKGCAIGDTVAFAMSHIYNKF